MNTFENCQPKTDASVANCQPKPVNCGCGGEAKVSTWTGSNATVINDCNAVYCENCGIQTKKYNTEAKAIQAWNKAMGERTAKAKVNFKDENFFFGWCECGQYQSSQHPYCPACGARLEWE
jgi:predicted ferric reductase